MIEKAGFADIG